MRKTEGLLSAVTESRLRNTFIQLQKKSFLYNTYMSIQSDAWIKRMVKSHNMIEPFEPKLIRDGKVSYGLSSYGYDFRVADEFKIFTNVHSAVVDPKNFDEKSFVDIKGEGSVLIPPNSFALTRTIEYVRIPRSVMGICIGKSTYARCFSGDTRVALVDGTAPTLEEMANRSEKGELFWGYSIGEHGRIIVTLLHAPRYIGRDTLLEVTLDNNQPIRCTPDHMFLLRDGQLRSAGDLRPGDSLMPLYRELYRGYEAVYQPLNGHLYPTHRLADEWNLRNEMYTDVPGTHRHHKDFNRLNNNPWNIERMEASAHIRMHNTENYGEEFDPEEHSSSIKMAFARLQSNPEWSEHFAQLQKERAQAFWSEERYAASRDLRDEHIREWWTEERKSERRENMLLYYSNAANRQKLSEAHKAQWARASESRRQQQAEIMRSIRIRNEITAEAVRFALDQTGSIRGAARLLKCDRSVFRRFPEVIHSFHGRSVRNHKVASIKELPGTHDVYCLTVPEAGNFALEAGVFVKNCGIIVNVTPIQPEFEGYIVIEISNTTPLPAKIYAGEGISEVVFFEADEVCEKSYKDLAGLYSNQKSIALPKV